jgi:hypothetical protein
VSQPDRERTIAAYVEEKVMISNLDQDTYAQRAEMLPRPGTIASHIMANIAGKVRELVEFIIPNRGKCFPDEKWPPRKLFRYLTWHYLNGNVFVVRNQGKIIGVGIAWPELARDIQQREALGEPHFSWKPQVRAGDCVMIAEVIGTKQAAFGWRKLALQRWPDLHANRFFTYRHGNLVELDYNMLARFAKARKLTVHFKEN